MIVRFTTAALLLAAAGLAAPAWTQGTPAAPASAAKEEPKAPPPPTVSTTRHTGTFGGQRVAYAATAGETWLKAEDGTPKASIFSIAYVKQPRDPSRPVTFLFNGGPCSGSLGLPLGASGPARVAIPAGG